MAGGVRVRVAQDWVVRCDKERKTASPRVQEKKIVGCA